MANSQNIKLGVCSVTYNLIDLGHTKGGVEVTYSPKYVPITADLYGDSKIDERLVGEALTAKVPLAEKTLANLGYAIPNGTLAGTGNGRLMLGQQSGQSLKTNAKQLVLHPIAEGSSRAFDIVLYKAAINSPVTLKHTNDGETVYEVTFEAYIDETKSQGSYLGLIGDSTT